MSESSSSPSNRTPKDASDPPGAVGPRDTVPDVAFADASQPDTCCPDTSRPDTLRPTPQSKNRELSICLIDMNSGHVNQAMRCFRGIVTAFFDRVRQKNPNLMCRVTEVSPR